MAACVGTLALLASARRGGAQSDPGSHAKLVGSITDAGNGHPLPGALVVVEGTVKNHVSSILAKMRVRDRTRAVLKAADRGLL